MHTSELQIGRTKAFCEQLDDLFNIAAANALEDIKNESDREFFKGQLQNGHPSEKPGIDIKIAAKHRNPKHQEDVWVEITVHGRLLCIRRRRR